MRRVRSAVLAGVLATLVLAGTLPFAATPAQAGDGWWGALDEGEAVSLRNVMRRPEQFRNRTLTFYCVLYTAAGEYKYYPPNTAFTEANFINFSAWPDGTPVWEREAFLNHFPFLYLRRTSAQRDELIRTERFTRLECTGRIRDIVRGRPAIEVFSFRETGHRLGKPIVDSVLWGLNYAKQGTREGYQSAARRFKEALQPDLPPTYAIIVRKYLADALRAIGHDEEADRYERGEAVGTPPLPTPEPGTAPGMPTEPGETFPDELPQPPTPGAVPAGPDPSAFPPALPEGLPEPPANPFMGEDLPGQPIDSGRGGMGATPDDELPGRAAPDARPATAPRTPARAPASGIPPKRRPRLHGVR